MPELSARAGRRPAARPHERSDVLHLSASISCVEISPTATFRSRLTGVRFAGDGIVERLLDRRLADDDQRRLRPGRAVYAAQRQTVRAPPRDHANRMTTAHPVGADPVVMFRNVVIGIRDVETGPDAIALAGRLVSANGELTLVHVREVGDKPAPDSGTGRDASVRRFWMERLTALAEASAIDAAVACLEAHSPRRGLHEFATRIQADLLVVRATARDEVERDLVGDDARRALQAAPCAVAIAPGGYGARSAAISRIGVAYDGSLESRQALAFARRLAAERDAELSAFEAVSTPVYAHDSWEMQKEIDRSVTRSRHRIAALGGLEAEAGLRPSRRRTGPICRVGGPPHSRRAPVHADGPLARAEHRSTSG